MDYRGWRLEAGPQEALLLPPRSSRPLQKAALPAVPILFPLPLSLFSALQQTGSFWKGKRMDIPRIGAGALGARDRASHLQGEQPAVSRPLAPNPRFHPTVSRQVLRPLKPPGIPSPKPPSASGFPAFSGRTF